ncbi:MAG: transposase [Anaerolineae bacterium]|nr:transposase [Anaerolineae bacterium]
MTRVWAPVGQTPIVAVHPQRDHVHFYGALNLCTGREIALPAPEATSALTANFLMQVLMLYPQPIFLLLDRAPWHYGEVSTLIAETDRLHVMHFPLLVPT